MLHFRERWHLFNQKLSNSCHFWSAILPNCTMKKEHAIIASWILVMKINIATADTSHKQLIKRDGKQSSIHRIES